MWMPELAASLVAEPRFIALAFFAALSGIVYGFAGFGSALIYIPVGAALGAPEEAVLAISLFGIGSVVTVLPRAWREADRSEVLPMLGLALVTVLLGGWLLRIVPEVPLRWVLSAVVVATLVTLMLGWRYRGRPSRGTSLSVGAASGLLGGATGLIGPVVILFYLGGERSAGSVRANTIVFLTLLGAGLLPALLLQGLITSQGLVQALLLVPFYMGGTWIGQWLFDPRHERLYRGVAYGIVALAVVVGLPVWG